MHLLGQGPAGHIRFVFPGVVRPVPPAIRSSCLPNGAPWDPGMEPCQGRDYSLDAGFEPNRCVESHEP